MRWVSCDYRGEELDDAFSVAVLSGVERSWHCQICTGTGIR